MRGSPENLWPTVPATRVLPLPRSADRQSAGRCQPETRPIIPRPPVACALPAGLPSLGKWRKEFAAAKPLGAVRVGTSESLGQGVRENAFSHLSPSVLSLPWQGFTSSTASFRLSRNDSVGKPETQWRTRGISAGARSIAPPVGTVALATSPSPSAASGGGTETHEYPTATHYCSATANARAASGARNSFRVDGRTKWCAQIANARR